MCWAYLGAGGGRGTFPIRASGASGKQQTLQRAAGPLFPRVTTHWLVSGTARSLGIEMGLGQEERGHASSLSWPHSHSCGALEMVMTRWN